MTELKELTIFQLSRKNISLQSKHNNQENNNLQRRQVSNNKYRLSMGYPKTYNNINKVRLSHKTVFDQNSNGLNRLKRRISTAGTSKRFPKDFFKMESQEDKKSKTPLFSFKIKKNVFEQVIKKKMQQKKLILKDRKKDLQNDISYQNTPKFNDPQSKEKQKQDINQFLILEDAPNYITPFLSMDAEPNQRTKFKKVKKSCNQKQKKKDKYADNCFRVRKVGGGKQ